MTTNTTNIELNITCMYNSVYVEESSGFIMFNKIITNDAFRENVRKECISYRDVKVNYNVVPYEVQTIDFLHTAVKSIRQYQHIRKKHV